MAERNVETREVPELAGDYRSYLKSFKPTFKDRVRAQRAAYLAQLRQLGTTVEEDDEDNDS